MLQYARWAIVDPSHRGRTFLPIPKGYVPHEGAIMTIYGDTLIVPKPIFGIDSEKEPLILDGFEIEKPSFERREEEVEKI